MRCHDCSRYNLVSKKIEHIKEAKTKAGQSLQILHFYQINVNAIQKHGLKQQHSTNWYWIEYIVLAKRSP